MTDGEFIEETSKLEKYYGKELETFQLKIWNEELGHLSVTKYRQIIRQILKTSKFMPKLADMLEVTNTMPKVNKETTREKVECDKCNGEGYILYTKLVDNGDYKIPYEYVARCDCDNGNEYIYDGRTINDTQHRSDYRIPSMSEIGF